MSGNARSALMILAVAGAAGSMAKAGCSTWVINPAPSNYVSGNSMCIADPDGPGGPLGSQLIIPNAFLSPADEVSGGVGRWDGTNLTQFGPFSTGSVLSSVQYNGQLVLGGNFGPDTSVFSVVQGGGSSWTALGNSGGETDSRAGDVGIYALAVFNGNLVAGGAFDSIDGVTAHSIAVWNGTSWTTLGAGFDGTVRALAVYNNDLYAAGAFANADGNPATNIAYFHAGSWHALAGGVGGDHSYVSGPKVNALAVYGGRLIVGGSFANANGASALNIAAWNGSVWTGLGTGIDETDADFSPYGGVSSLAIVNNLLYAGGVMDQAGGVTVDGIAVWNGATWSGVGSASLDSGLGVGHLAALGVQAYQNKLVAAGFSFDDFSTFLATYTPCSCPADFNNSGSVTVQDIFDFLTVWFARGPAADINGSGTITVQDIFDFLAHWFAGC